MKWCSCDTYSPSHYDRCQWCHKPLNAGTDPVVERIIFSGPLPPSTTPPPLSQRMSSSSLAGAVTDRHGKRPPKGQTSYRRRQDIDVRMGATRSSPTRHPDAHPPHVQSLVTREPARSPSTATDPGLSTRETVGRRDRMRHRTGSGLEWHLASRLPLPGDRRVPRPVPLRDTSRRPTSDRMVGTARVTHRGVHGANVRWWMGHRSRT